MRLLAIVGLVVAAFLPPAHAQTARGVVFEDLDADGVRDPGEPGIPGVRVSDGRTVTETDPAGGYELRIGDRAIVFVVKPAGWTTPVSDDMLPRFYYVHQPAGSRAGLRYAGIEPTGPLPESVDFPLRRVDEPERFEAILFADTQPQTAVEVDFVRDDVVAELIGTSARFGMTMGDVMFDDLSLLPRFNAILGQIGIPWYNVPGNHDLNLRAEGDGDSLETFKRFFGPPYYSFDYGRAHFVVLDDIVYQGGDNSDPANYRADGGYEARITDEQLEWLKNDLALVPEDRLVVLAMHAPRETYTDRPGSKSGRVQNRRELLSLLAGRPHLYAVAGHTHTTEHHYFGEEDGFPGPGTLHHHVLTTVSGSWWSGPIDDRGIAVAEQRDGTPNGYHVLEVDGVDLKVRYKAAGMPEDYQMRIVFDVAHFHHEREAMRDFRPGDLLDGRFSEDEVAAAQLVVNLFDGGPRSHVEYSLPGRPPVAMERRLSIDPWVNELFLRNEDSKKWWVDATPSSHVWVADLPDDLGPGVYTVTVRATDEFGRTHHAHRVLEITGSSAPPHALRYPDGAGGETDARVLAKEIVVAAPMKDVWNAWTTEDGLRFVSQSSRVELRPGGPYEWFLDLEPDANGRRGGEGAEILSVVPGKRLEFTWTFPPAIPTLRLARATTTVTVTLEPSGDGGTRVRFEQSGWRDGADWDAGHAYFDKAWDFVLDRLKTSLESRERP